MERKNLKITKKEKDSKPFTAGEFIEYLQMFPKDAPLAMTHVRKKPNGAFGYQVKNFVMITDSQTPHIIIELGRETKLKNESEKLKKEG